MIKFNEIKNLEELKVAKNLAYSKDEKLIKLKETLKTCPKEQKKEVGIQISQLLEFYEQEFKKVELRLQNEAIAQKISSQYVDVNTPVEKPGSLHPITLIENRLRDWFLNNGYYEQEAGEICSDLYNFERLNMPSNHPARAMHDSLYLNPTTLLRTHNTGASAVELEKNVNKEFSTFTIGKVYRNDEDDATHSHQFTQIDFISVGKVSFSNLIWTLKSMLSYVFELELEIRLRPSYFPFTEPSVEVDIFYKNRWIEILGAGMIHPNVLELAGYNNDMNGLAGGVGIERLTMIKYGIEDIRDLYKNDLRVLEQFNNEI
ncbi:phenylalanine--tRNA ligase subunit alpha [Mycoplasmopsis alligatoris]|uniref:phenylalanine--tRNA ligase n=1 Tax=Mycoplasmopsis alligatoris A21JP2 TaxID=747682 RepID=D4XVY0_9BACT|nr:phenylalanine--tRNA ligase subunit alpha [Mycoplasmopsis alligatoris]EFF41502.1 phenylalanyl-tRNA synthetase, alpha subunit [Mycoplasmopsis alligatoris A21JP2]